MMITLSFLNFKFLNGNESASIYVSMMRMCNKIKTNCFYSKKLQPKQWKTYMFTEYQWCKTVNTGVGNYLCLLTFFNSVGLVFR